MKTSIVVTIEPGHWEVDGIARDAWHVSVAIVRDGNGTGSQAILSTREAAEAWGWRVVAGVAGEMR